MTDQFDASALGPTEKRLLAAMAENWWLFLVRGVFAIVFGVLAVVWPLATIFALTLMWGAYALVDGGIALWAGVSGHVEARGDRWWLSILGVFGIIAGLFALFAPGVVATALLLTIGIWAIVIGLFQVVGAIRLRKEIEGEWLLGLGGVLLVAFGVMIFLQPTAGALSVIWLISLSSTIYGVIMVVLAFKLRAEKSPD